MEEETKKIIVTFEGCEDGNCMFAQTTDEYGYEIKLYSMVSCEEYFCYLRVFKIFNDETFEDNDFDMNNLDMNDFDDFSYPILKEDIIKQAEEKGIDINRLEFWWD